MNSMKVEEDLQYIRQMIENNRRRIVDNGLMFINTGIYVVVGLICTYILNYYKHFDMVPYLWLILMSFLIVLNYFSGKKQTNATRKKAFGNEMFSATWISCGIPILILFLSHVFGNMVSLSVFISMTSFLLGIGYFLTGTIIQLKLMKILAFCWWAGGFMALYWINYFDTYYLGIVFSFMVILLEIIPGMIIYKKWKRVYNGKTI